jgi:hypothetical protein
LSLNNLDSNFTTTPTGARLTDEQKASFGQDVFADPHNLAFTTHFMPSHTYTAAQLETVEQ